MNWDISIGRCKQWYGRALQILGSRLDRRQMVLDGERLEFGGRLQMRYGWLKHQVQWNTGLVRIGSESTATRALQERMTAAKRLSL